MKDNKVGETRANNRADDGFAGEMVLKELKEELEDYLCFVSADWIVCDVCNQRVKVWNFPSHVENEHYDPPTRVWSKGTRAGWRKRWRQL